MVDWLYSVLGWFKSFSGGYYGDFWDGFAVASLLGKTIRGILKWNGVGAMGFWDGVVGTLMDQSEKEQ